MSPIFGGFVRSSFLLTESLLTRGHVMDKTTFDENEENFLVHEISDEALELLAYTGMQTSPFT
jgi:hypothetical protein